MTLSKPASAKKITFDEDMYDEFISGSDEKIIIIDKIKSLLNSKYTSCLEIGLGTIPIFSNSLSNLFKKYTIVEKGHTNIPLQKNVEFINADWETMEITQKYDLIIASHVVYYFHDKKLAIQKIFDSLTPNGTVIFVVNGKDADYGQLKSKFSELIKEDYVFTYDILKSMLKEHPFQEVSIPSKITFQSHEELYNSLKLSFDHYPQKYAELKNQIVSYLEESLNTTESFIISQVLFVCKNNPWGRLLKHEDYELKIKDLTLTIKADVFTPDPELTFSTMHLLENIPDVKDKRVLDMGCGTGIVGIYCLKNGASDVVFADNNSNALENTRINLRAHNRDTNTRIINSDLFKNINQKFDYIFANLPISKQLWGGESNSEAVVLNFIIECQNYINPGGEVFFTWASFEDIAVIKQILERLNYNYTISVKDALGYNWYLFKISFNI